MKKLILSLAAVAALGTAMPAAAQTWSYGRVAYTHNIPGLNRTINQREATLAARVDLNRQQRQITAREAQVLRTELQRIEAVEHQYRRRGLSQAEFANLTVRLNRVQTQLDQARHNHRFGHRW